LPLDRIHIVVIKLPPYDSPIVHAIEPPKSLSQPLSGRHFPVIAVTLPPAVLPYYGNDRMVASIEEAADFNVRCIIQETAVVRTCSGTKSLSHHRHEARPNLGGSVPAENRCEQGIPED